MSRGLEASRIFFLSSSPHFTHFPANKIKREKKIPNPSFHDVFLPFLAKTTEATSVGFCGCCCCNFGSSSSASTLLRSLTTTIKFFSPLPPSYSISYFSSSHLWRAFSDGAFPISCLPEKEKEKEKEIKKEPKLPPFVAA